jgi:hypothetical protein
MYKKLAVLGILMLVGAGCTSTQPTESHSNSDHMMMVSSSPQAVFMDGTQFKAGLVEFNFKIYGSHGQELTDADLQVNHDKKMHFILVRDDLNYFQHLHPAYQNGVWGVTTTITNPGTYNTYADIEPTQEAASVIRTPLVIGGTTSNAHIPTPTANLAATDGTIRARLVTTSSFKTKENTVLTFAITEKGKAVTNLQPYLGAFGHVVLLRHDNPDSYLHVHPVTEAQPTDGNVVFATTFPEKGRYSLYAQFNVGGAIKTFSITLDVTQEGVALRQEPSETHSIHNMETH